MNDLEVWELIGEAGRRFVTREEEVLAVHTSAAELGWGGSLGA